METGGIEPTEKSATCSSNSWPPPYHQLFSVNVGLSCVHRQPDKNRWCSPAVQTMDHWYYTWQAWDSMVVSLYLTPSLHVSSCQPVEFCYNKSVGLQQNWPKNSNLGMMANNNLNAHRVSGSQEHNVPIKCEKISINEEEMKRYHYKRIVSCVTIFLKTIRVRKGTNGRMLVKWFFGSVTSQIPPCHQLRPHCFTI